VAACGPERSEIDGHRRTHRRVFGLEVLSGREVAHVRNDGRRESLDPRVERPHVAVVEPAAGGDAIFGLGELPLQFEEVRVGLQGGVVLGDVVKKMQNLRNIKNIKKSETI